ncbi:glycosyltransferase [Rhizobiaceae bacterium BDR2-2]|uniref:Glycosyltransferase n=1 Tax=Ectorhizobium quercum TaxID=2965071 RepID=A0AAE3N216_9HYPH|nr:glycosyltransferase [Ectorhizobium quercum]MCX8996225.1 glycosyltransferase [Ectorhizobium quercum]MCX8998736.1 glycosyltransferase [Ectorhizobium quercum]
MLDVQDTKGRETLPPRADASVLLVTAVRLRRGPRGLQLDDQTCAGLVRYAENFRQVTFAGIVLDAEREEDTSVAWVDVVDLPCSGRVEFMELPFAYRITAFARTYRRTRALLGQAIRDSDHLCFTLGYLSGDWGAVAALEADAQGRKFAVWFDRVEHDVILRTLPDHRFRRRMKERMTLPVMKRYHRYLIGRSSLGLFQGRDTYNAYAGFSSNPVCMYDVHTQRADRIDGERLEAKVERLLSGAPLRIVYVGRAAAMKGPQDWIDALAAAAGAGVPLEARWLGDGPLVEAMRGLIREKGLSGHIRLAGHVADREAVLDAMRDSDLFVFCHKTPESPRCLIEALVCGCPIVGYTSPYAEDLVAEQGGGVLTPLHDAGALGRRIADLATSRRDLAQLVRDAAASGARFDEETLYRRRADLLVEFA